MAASHAKQLLRFGRKALDSGSPPTAGRKVQTTMESYERLPGLENLYLEDSWVLGVSHNADELRFDVEAVLTEGHPDWHQPLPGEVHAYKRLEIVFQHPREVVWVERMSGPPAVDASGERDYGHIDTFTWEGSSFDLQGDWGRVQVTGDPPAVLEPGTA